MSVRMDNENIGVAVVIQNHVSKEILLVEEPETSISSNKKQGDLSLVVGHVKNGESPIEAVTREIAEETGLSGVVPNKLVKVFYFRKGHVVFLFSCEIDTSLGGKFRWCSLDEIRRLENLRPQVIDAVGEFEKGGFVGADLILTD